MSTNAVLPDSWNIKLVRAGFRRFLWYGDDKDDEAPMPPDGIESTPVSTIFPDKGSAPIIGRAVLYHLAGDCPEVEKGETHCHWLGRVLGYLYPSDALGRDDWSAPGWSATFIIKSRKKTDSRTFIWTEFLPVAYDTKRMDKRLRELRKVVEEIDEDSYPFILLDTNEGKFGTPYKSSTIT